MFFEKFVSLAIRSNVWKSEYLKVLSGNLEIKKFAKSNVCKSKNLKVPLSLSLYQFGKFQNLLNISKEFICIDHFTIILFRNPLDDRFAWREVICLKMYKHSR